MRQTLDCMKLDLFGSCWLSCLPVWFTRIQPTAFYAVQKFFLTIFVPTCLSQFFLFGFSSFILQSPFHKEFICIFVLVLNLGQKVSLFVLKNINYLFWLAWVYIKQSVHNKNRTWSRFRSFWKKQHAERVKIHRLRSLGLIFCWKSLWCTCGAMTVAGNVFKNRPDKILNHLTPQSYRLAHRWLIFWYGGEVVLKRSWSFVDVFFRWIKRWKVVSIVKKSSAFLFLFILFLVQLTAFLERSVWPLFALKHGWGLGTKLIFDCRCERNGLFGKIWWMGQRLARKRIDFGLSFLLKLQLIIHVWTKDGFIGFDTFGGGIKGVTIAKGPKPDIAISDRIHLINIDGVMMSVICNTVSTVDGGLRDFNVAGINLAEKCLFEFVFVLKGLEDIPLLKLADMILVEFWLDWIVRDMIILKLLGMALHNQMVGDE